MTPDPNSSFASSSAEIQKLQDENADLIEALERVNSQGATAASVGLHLDRLCNNLESENASLKARIEELEGAIKRFMDKPQQRSVIADAYGSAWVKVDNYDIFRKALSNKGEQV